jgi:hypothetical protein
VAAETGFSIDGTIYPVPDLGTFNMDEAQVMFDYSGLSMEDFVVPEDETEDEQTARERRLRNPGFLRALMHIAYQRANPTVRPNRVKSLIGNATVIDALGSLVVDDEPEDVDVPLLDVTPQPSESSKNAWDDSNANSGGGSNGDSDEPDVPREPTGTTKSPTSPTSDPTTWE